MKSKGSAGWGSAALAVAAFAAEPRLIFIDPASRWVSIHDKDGTGAALEFAQDLRKACPSVSITDNRDGAALYVAFQRNGYNAGRVGIYRGGKLVDEFAPGHAATLKKVAERVCGFAVGQP